MTTPCHQAACWGLALHPYLLISASLLQTPLHLAVYLEQPSVVQALIHKGVNPGLQDRNGNTPLHLACEQQRLRCAQQLLQGTTEPPGHLQDLQLQNWQGETQGAAQELCCKSGSLVGDWH